jgi:hypothetical protein
MREWESGRDLREERLAGRGRAFGGREVDAEWGKFEGWVALNINKEGVKEVVRVGNNPQIMRRRAVFVERRFDDQFGKFGAWNIIWR